MSEEREEKRPEARPRYEAPVVVPLGELARGRGASCGGGSAPTGQCGTGHGANPCHSGSGAANNCIAGAQR